MGKVLTHDNQFVVCPHCNSQDCFKLEFKYNRLQYVCSKTNRVLNYKKYLRSN